MTLDEKVDALLDRMGVSENPLLGRDSVRKIVTQAIVDEQLAAAVAYGSYDWDVQVRGTEVRLGLYRGGFRKGTLAVSAPAARSLAEALFDAASEIEHPL